jgi:hypothetical protein
MTQPPPAPPKSRLFFPQWNGLERLNIPGLVLSRFLLMKVKEAGRPGAAKAVPASTGGLGGLGAGALVSGGPLTQPMQVFSPKKEKKKRDKDG